MKKLFSFIPAAVFALTLSGCALIGEHKDDIKAAIIEYAETKGQDAAIAYVDRLVADGKLGSANAEKIKAAIPQGVAKLKETLTEKQ